MYYLNYSLILSLLFHAIFCYNIDVQSPYVIKVQAGQEDSLFGFSTALHIYQDKKSILVGAPRANWTSGAGAGIASPGAVYQCPLDSSIANPTEEAICDSQVTYLTDNNAANKANEDKANQWLGVNVQATDEHVTACAHRYVSVDSDSNGKRMPIGKCTVIGSSLRDDGLVEKKTLDPCRDNTGLNWDSGSCQVGASQVQLQDGDKSYLLYGAPGVDIWEGSAYLAESLDDVKLSKKIDKRNVDPWDFNQYIGYAVAICRMSGPDNPLDMITAAPRANNYLGELHFYVSDNTNTNEKTLLRNSRISEEPTGDQMGAYFGYSMACGDLDADGNDDLLVSAPWYSMVTNSKSSIISVGRVYVYYGDKNKVISNSHILEAPNTATSAFGLGMAHIGDINKDDYQDFAIGAPYENDYKGAVYIYHGSRNGIKKTPVQAIYPTDLGNGLGSNLKSFGWSISANKDMDDNDYPDMAIGSYMSDRVVYLRSLPIVDLNIEIVIPSDPVDLLVEDKLVPDSAPQQYYPGTTLKICFRTQRQSIASYEVDYEVELDYKQSYAPRAFFQTNAASKIEFKKSGTKLIDVSKSSTELQCTPEWIVFLKKKDQMFDEQAYIEVNMTANIKESADIASRAVLKQEQVTAAKGRIVIKSICTSDTGICQCDVELKEPSVTYLPAGYDSIVLDNVNQVIVKYEVENLGPDNAHVPTLILELPPKVTFIRRTPVDDQTEADVSQIACSEIESNDKNYVMCFLQDPLKVGEPSKFGIKLDTMSLTEAEAITLTAKVNIGSPSEEKAEKLSNNERTIQLNVGRQANLEIRGTAATDNNAIENDLALLQDDAFLRSIKLEVRHTVSVLIKESEKKDGDDEGIKDIVVEINWPMKDHDGNYLLYLSEVYVKDNQIKDNFEVSSNVIDPDCHFDYNADCTKQPSAFAVTDDEVSQEELERAANAAALNTNCSVPDPGCTKFNVTIKLLKAGSINMKDLEFEMRSIIWLPNVINRGDFNATSTARIVSVGQNLVIPPGSSVEMRTRVYEVIKTKEDVLWIIIGSVIGGVAILAILIVVLWKVGFFKRKMPPRDGSGSM